MNGVNWTAVAGAFVAGCGVGAAVVRTLMEKEERGTTVYQYIECARDHNVGEAPVATEEELSTPLEKKLSTPISEITDHNGDQLLVVPAQRVDPEALVPDENPYHKAIAATETPVDVFVGGGINDYGVSYIEEEDYLDEDGRFKGKIDIMMDDHNPIFLMEGEQITDWDQRVGDSILVDFYKLVPPGADEVLYVRNHRTDEDYEVVRVLQ